MRTRIAFVGAWLLVAASACGDENPADMGARDAGGTDDGAANGGAGEPDAAPGPDALPPPPPTVVSSVPAAAATRVDPSGPFAVTFSEPMAASAASAVRLVSQVDEEPVDVQSAIDGATVTLVPTDRLPSRTAFRLVVEGAESEAGGVLAAPVEIPFVVGGAEPVAPRLGSAGTQGVDCRDRYVLPAAVSGPDGLGAFGWTFDLLHVPVAWPFSNRGTMPWISDNSRSVPSVRINVERGPETGRCFVEELRAGATAGLSSILQAQSAFHDPSVGIDTLSVATYEAPAYPEDDELTYPLTSAVWGLFEGIEPVAGAPGGSWNDDLRSSLERTEAAYPGELTAALTDLVHALGEAHILREASAGAVGSARWLSMIQSLTPYAYERSQFLWLEPIAVLPDLSTRLDGAGVELIDVFELADSSRAAQRVASAAEAVRAVATTLGPFEAPSLDVVTPLGRLVVRPGASDDASAPDDAALFLDVAGDDAYPGRVASTHLDHLAASVLIDVAGNDRYGPQGWTLETVTDAPTAFATADGLTQGAGLFGVGILIDGAGDDVYRSTTFGQGMGLFGVGVLYDVEGSDRYEATYFGQGAGQVGVGLLVDGAGNDTYTVGAQGQGLGRPRGQGVLLDVQGDDDYLALHDDDPPQLLEKHPLWFPSGYRDELDEEHNMSVAMGVGWGFRGDWFTDETNWAGGLGAAVDLGNGRDVRFADAMSMGQGFVYGMGLLHDDGGDDIYRAFWWSFGSGTHMGTGMMFEAGGNDDLTIGQFSAALGHDTGVSWYIDQGGDDLYGGQMTYGRALDHGLAFFIEEGGDDIYEGVRSVNHGVCDINPEVPVNGLRRLGLFLDQGSGADAYLTPNEAAENDAAWYQAPNRGGDPTEKRGIGLDF